ncbi:MAG: trimethylamine methyltransferase family protein [Alphaproteobacteria bacterium]
MARSTSLRHRRQSTSGPAPVRQVPWKQPANPYPPIRVLSDDQVEAIHRSSLRILRDTGMEVMHGGARDRFRQAGATVDDSTMRVRFDPALVEQLVSTVPSDFVLRSRTGRKDLHGGGNNFFFGAVGGPAFYSTLDTPRRPGTFEALLDGIKLCQHINAIHLAGAPFEPVDLPAESRYLDVLNAVMTLSDKAYFGSAMGSIRANDAIDMACIAFGETRQSIAAAPVIYSGINTNSPLRLDVPMATGLMAFAEAAQPIFVTPFTLAGAMSPVTLAGSLAQQNAEALAGIALTQIVRPGTPAVYGAFTTNVDMRSGAPAFGTPEYMLAAHASGQLARRYGFPFRSSGTTCSVLPDEQSVYETLFSLWGAVMGGANMIWHAAGWTDGGLTCSYEKMIIDAEMLQTIMGYMQPIQVNDETLAEKAIAEVGPGGHFFGTQHTIDRYETAFYSPMLSDWRNYESWVEGGSVDTRHRANAIWKQMLKEFEAPPLDPARKEELDAFVIKAKERIDAGAHPDAERDL